MKMHEQSENSSGAAMSQEDFTHVNPDPAAEEMQQAKASSSGWESDIKQTLQLGEQLVGFAGGVFDLARVEAMLAVRTIPKLMMLWLLMMPIILLTWCAFSALMSWVVVAATDQIGFGILTFFLLQVFLLLVCRLLFVKYRTCMTFPYTRAQIDNFIRSAQYEINHQSKAKK